MSASYNFFSCAFNVALHDLREDSSFQREIAEGKGETSSCDEGFPYDGGLITDEKIRKKFQWIKCIAVVSTFVT